MNRDPVIVTPSRTWPQGVEVHAVEPTGRRVYIARFDTEAQADAWIARIGRTRMQAEREAAE